MVATRDTPCQKAKAESQTVDRSALLERAERTLSAVPRPFLRWAGSKQRVLRHLVPFLPPGYNRYFEPFLGSGSLFFLLRPTKAVLSDACSELIETFEAVEGDPECVLHHLARLNPLDKEMYYRVRSRRSNDPCRRTAEFIYLNRAGWNGLYRVNSKGEFNVPYGAPKTASIVDRENLLSCARLLRRRSVRLQADDFESAVAGCEPGDFVFVDPPYVTGHNNNGFIDYNERLFSWADQVRLASTVRLLAESGVHVMVTNAHHDRVLKLYGGFEVTPIVRSSTIAASTAARRPVTESVITSFAPTPIDCVE